MSIRIHPWLKIAPWLLPLAWLWWVLIQQLRIAWTANPQYAYGWAVPFLCAYLLWRRSVGRASPRADIETPGAFPVGCSMFGVPCSMFPLILTVCALLYAPVRLVQQANPGWSLVSWPLAFIVIALTFHTLHHIGFRISDFGFPFGFFLVAVPWPYVLENPVVQTLARFNTALTIEVLGWLGVPAVQHGNVIELATGHVGIDEACSGIRSLQATLMLALFFGEIYRLRPARRVALCGAGLALAMICNLGRTLLLTWVAARRGLEAIAGWHDPAGVTILVACFTGLWLISLALRSAGRATPGAPPSLECGDSSPLSAHGDLSPTPSESLRSFVAGHQRPRLALRLWPWALCAWLVLVELGVAAWYRRIEAGLPAQVTWRIAWPEGKPGFRDVPISPKAAQLLRFDAARQGHWTEADGTDWQLSWFYWKAGQAAGYLAKSHNPLVCLPAAGYEAVSYSPVEFADLPGLRLPYRLYWFRQEGKTVYVLYTRWEDRAVEQSFATEGVTRFNRLQSVWRGRGIHGQRVISFALWGAPGPGQARERLLRQLESLVVAASS